MRLILVFIALLPLSLFAQKSSVTITVTESGTNTPVYGAKIALNETFKAYSDNDGKVYFEQVPTGTYTLTATMLSFDTIQKVIKINEKSTSFSIQMGGSLEIEEMKVIGNLVTDRKTPIAVTKISTQKIEEELGSRDIPMLLNATPGVYATNSGGGDGDSRITVRGFDQRNVGVMIDGVPVNDMENGSVYWSNWFGLDAITSNIQVQRGLGATKIAMPSIGGTINIITAGVGSKKGLSFKQELASGMFLRSTVSYNSGMLKNGFGFTFSGSYKQGNGWVDGTPTQGGFIYAKVQKKIKKHLLSLSAFSAPQKHGQRSFNQPIQYFDSEFAADQGVAFNPNGIADKGIRFNEHYGYRTEDGKRKILSERLNYYNKPQITLKDFWQVNKKLSVSNLAYASIGRGGGTKASNYGALVRDADGLIDWDAVEQSNKFVNQFGQVVSTIDPYYSPTEYKSNQIITASVNNHFWVGYLGQLNYELSKAWSFSGGLDYRSYKGTHYREIKDLLGGDYIVNNSNENQSSPVLRVGDKMADNGKPYENHRDGLVQWGGVFGQVEYSSTRWTAFLNLSAVVNGYKGIDYFQKKQLDLGDTVLRIGADDVINYNGQTYDANSSGLEYYQTEWKWVPGYTFKAGANYTLNEENNVFLNLGYLNRTPMFSNVIDNNFNRFFENILNEKILAAEVGYSYTLKNFGLNFNAYATNWKNKPIPFGVAIPDPEDPTSTIRLNVQGMDAIHLGTELDLAWNLSKKWSSEVMLSYGDWKWNSAQTLFIPQLNSNFTFDAKGVHVGDAPQSTYSVSLRYEPIKKLYFKVQYMYFDRFYAQFSPFNLKGANAGRDSWKMPAYGLLNLFAGYKYKLKKTELLFNGSITNVLNSRNITDATDNYYGTGFDASSASVMFGQGLRFNVSVGIQL